MTTPSRDTPALALTDIELHYGFVRALDGIDMHVMPGEVVALLGDNGAGKSTLLKVMSGAHKPSHGTIRVHGVEHSFQRAERRAAEAGIQMVYQDLALVEPQDISTNLNMGQEQLRRGPLGWLGFVDRKAMRRSSEAELDRLGVRTAPMTRPVEMLSGGQRQVVALARSAIRVNGESQGILLLDEPTAALGYEQTKNVEALIRRMADQGIAIVLVTHDLPLCYEVADRIVILNRGKKVADVPAAGTDRDHVVGWITGSRASMFPVPAGGLSHGRSTPRSPTASTCSRASPRSRRRWPTRSRTDGCASSWSRPLDPARRRGRPATSPSTGRTARCRCACTADEAGHRPARPALAARRRLHVRRPRHARGRPHRARGLRPAGAVVVSVDYRLAVGGVHHPVPLDDCVAAARWLRDSAAELGVDPDRITVGGASAGGNLATATVLRLRDEDGWQPASLVAGLPGAAPRAARPSRRGGRRSSTRSRRCCASPPRPPPGINANYLGGPPSRPTATPSRRSPT